MTHRKYTRADLPVGIFATVRARGGHGSFVARVDSFPAGSRMAVGVSLDTGRRVRFSPARVLGVTADAADARSESDVRRARRLERNRRRSEDADQRRIDRFNGALRALFNVHAAADYDARHGAGADGLPLSDVDPSTGTEYGRAI